ncbi:ATP-dependent zinc metalloprotease FtsH [Candidatus Dojkabacteria bacterium]|jgi:cell division protease FtsH|nr:ATP-dependent zinc metalloprotease FtsH [Candidatus Dojkabacteria bacterium]
MSEKAKAKEVKPEVKKEGGANIVRFKPTVKVFNITNIVISIVVFALIFGAWSWYSSSQSKGKDVPLSTIVNDISKGDYSGVAIKDQMIILNKEVTKSVNGKEVKVVEREYSLVQPGTNFYQILKDAGIDIKTLKNDNYSPSFVISISDIIWIILLTVGLVIMFNMVRGMQANGGKIMDFGQSKARLLFGKKSGITFASVAGIEEVKEELIEIVDFLKNPKKYKEIGARIPKGVLLAGAPGTGKTLLAKAVAGEANVPFFHTSGSEFEEMLVGAGASRVRDLFQKARKAAPCIIFIDEIDAVAKKRGTVLHSGAGEQTLNQILVELDGLEERENVIVLGATNRPDVLDPALLRPGRFDRVITVQMPDYQERLAILEVHAKNKKFAKDADLSTLAKKTVGHSGADLENVLNEAAIKAATDDRKEITQKDLTTSYLKVLLGRQQKSNKIEDDMKRVAYHESGHAIVAHFTPGDHPVELVSMISRGLTGGVTMYVPEDDKTLHTKSDLIASIQIAVGGKISEEMFLEEMSTGAGSDIEHATDNAKLMVRKFGMSDKLGFVKYGDLEETSNLGYSYGGGRDYSDKTAQDIDDEIKSIIDAAQKEAKRILTTNKEYVEKLVKMLLEKEEVTREEFNSIFEK